MGWLSFFVLFCFYCDSVTDVVISLQVGVTGGDVVSLRGNMQNAGYDRLNIHMLCPEVTKQVSQDQIQQFSIYSIFVCWQLLQLSVLLQFHSLVV